MHAINGPSDHNIDYHLIHHSPTSIYDDNCFTLINLYGLSHYSDTFQAAEALQPSLMVISGPYYLDNHSKYDQIHFPLKDSLHDPMLLINIHLVKNFRVFKRIISNFTIQFLNGWRNITCQATHK